MIGAQIDQSVSVEITTLSVGAKSNESVSINRGFTDFHFNTKTFVFEIHANPENIWKCFFYIFIFRIRKEHSYTFLLQRHNGLLKSFQSKQTFNLLVID